MRPSGRRCPTAGGEASRGSFHYDVDVTGFTGSSSVAPNGNIVVSSTGRVGGRSRTISATVRRSGFVDYVYYTDLETQDPLTYPEEYREAAVANCSSYYGTRHASCTDIAFSNDTLNGPVHSNDTMLVCGGVTFKDTVTTGSGPVAANAGKPFRVDGCASTAGTTFLRPEDPLDGQADRPALDQPRRSRPRPAPSASPRGCLYVGPTKIVVSGSQLRVTSPWTKTVTPGCAKDTFFPIPVNGVVYVDVVPAEGTSDVNSWGATEAGKPTCPSTGNNVGFPIASETDWYYPCKAGDVFIEQLDGLTRQRAAGPAHRLGQQRPLRHQPPRVRRRHGRQLLPRPDRRQLRLRLAPGQRDHEPQPARAEHAVPRRAHLRRDAERRRTPSPSSTTAPVASLGTLNITGALIQKYRGIVRGGSSGYAKNYVYDQRLRYDAPPKFLNPTISSFGVVRTAEAKPQYR